MSAPVYPEHRIFVGKPEWFDILGGRHFMLLFLLGIREEHRLLDFGCGSLRSGRLLIPYLLPDRYFGIDPNSWLIEAAIEHEFGRSILEVKRPRFDGNADCRLDVFGVKFDFIHAHSVFTHAPLPMIRRFLLNLRASLAPGGIFVGTWVRGEDDCSGADWAYPTTVTYKLSTFRDLVEGAGLALHLLQWPHPEQTYFAATEPETDLRSRLVDGRSAFGIDLLRQTHHRDADGASSRGVSKTGAPATC